MVVAVSLPGLEKLRVTPSKPGFDGEYGKRRGRHSPTLACRASSGPVCRSHFDTVVSTDRAARNSLWYWRATRRVQVN